MLRTSLFSFCLLLGLSAFAGFNDKNINQSHKENNRKNHDCGYTQNNVLSKQATKDIAIEKKTDYQWTKDELHSLKGSVSHILKTLENSPERENEN